MKNEGKIILDIYTQLQENEMFGNVYKQFKETRKVDIELIRSEIRKNKPALAESTVNRRVSTIKAWVEWMYAIDGLMWTLPSTN